MVLHVGILYTPFLQALFSIEPMNAAEWKAVLLISLPVILIDEVLKFVERKVYMRPATDARSLKMAKDGSEANGKLKEQ